MKYIHQTKHKYDIKNIIISPNKVMNKISSFAIINKIK